MAWLKDTTYKLPRFVVIIMFLVVIGSLELSFTSFVYVLFIYLIFVISFASVMCT